MPTKPAPPRLLLLAAFAAVYLLWGSTYLAIKYAIAGLPPLLMAGSRFVLAGGILWLVGRLSVSYEAPGWRQWRTSLVVGALLLVGGNGAVVLAERTLPSGLAALLVASEPFWVVLLGWWWLGQAPPGGRVVLGLLLGFGGVWLLVGPQLQSHAEPGQLLGAGLVLAAAFSWAAGSIYGLRAPAARSPVLGAGMQMLCGGALLLALGAARGEGHGLHLAQVPASAWLGWGFLVVFGSLVAFTAYSWLLQHAPPARVATYAYVNPVVAVGLGWALRGEPLSGGLLLGAAVVVGAVVLITTGNSGAKADSEAASQV